MMVRRLDIRSFLSWQSTTLDAPPERDQASVMKRYRYIGKKRSTTSGLNTVDKYYCNLTLVLTDRGTLERGPKDEGHNITGGAEELYKRLENLSL